MTSDREDRMANSRSVTEVLQDIIGNVQEIVRSEVRLAKTEIREEAIKAKSSGAFLGAGALLAIYAGGVLILGFVFALAAVMPLWAAAFIVALAAAAAAGLLLNGGKKRLQEVHPKPERTVESVKENVAWVKRQTK
jgi:Flp pilus assembly protein TadB